MACPLLSWLVMYMTLQGPLGDANPGDRISSVGRERGSPPDTLGATLWCSWSNQPAKQPQSRPQEAAPDVPERLLCGHRPTRRESSSGRHLSRCSTPLHRPSHLEGIPVLATLLDMGGLQVVGARPGHQAITESVVAVVHMGLLGQGWGDHLSRSGADRPQRGAHAQGARPLVDGWAVWDQPLVEGWRPAGSTID